MQSKNTKTVQLLEASDIPFPWPPFPHVPAATSWWLTDTGITWLGGIAVNLLAIAITATLVVLFARSVRADTQKTANSLSAIVQHLKERKTPARADLATAVCAHMNATYYQGLIAAVEHAMLRNGFTFGKDAANEVHMPPYVVKDISKDLTRAQAKHLYPLDGDITARIEHHEETGYSKQFVRSIIAAMREQGQFVERSFEIVSR